MSEYRRLTEEQKFRRLHEMEAERILVLAFAEDSLPGTTGKLMWEQRAKAIQEEILELERNL